MSLVSLNTSGRPATPVDRARKALDGFTVGQRAMVVIAVVALAVGGLLFSSWASKPSLTPLYSGLSATDASSVVDKLKAQGISYSLADSGQTVLVPQSKVYDLRLSMAAAGLPSDNQSGYAILDKQGITTSDFQQHVGYQRALEGELAKTIQAIASVSAAQVHLVVPRDDVFATDSQKPSAAVLVTTRDGSTLASDSVQAIVHLVSSSVSGMTADEVTVADAQGHVLAAPGQAAGLAGDQRSEQTKAYEAQLTSSLQSMLDGVLGAGHALVRVSADLNLDATQTTTQSAVVVPGATPTSQTTSKETYTGSGAAQAAGVLGVTTGTTGTAGTAGGTNTYSKETSDVTNPVGQQTVTTTSTPGAVKQLAVAVVLDAKSAGAANQATVTQLVRTAAGFNQARGDTVTVSTLPFATTAASGAAATTAKAAKKPTDLLGLITTGALVLGLLLVGLATWRGAKGEKRTPVLLPAERAELEAARTALAAVEARAIDAHHSLPEGSVPTQRSAMDDSIGDLVDSQPDEVAQLLRGWLAEAQ